MVKFESSADLLCVTFGGKMDTKTCQEIAPQI